MKSFYIGLGCLIVSFGVLLLNQASISTGGTVGLSLTVAYAFNHSFSTAYLLVNLPFYLLSIVKFGWRFTLTTAASVTLLSLLSIFHSLIPSLMLPVWLGSVLGGFIIGLGMALLLMNGSSLGGSNILALYLQQKGAGILELQC